MVGIVLVSHSKALAEAACELVKQAARDACVVGVGGTGEGHNEFGTDAMAIMDAIQEVYSDEGVLLLMDMGSALLSAETALEFLDEDIAKRVLLCSAPLVEGGVVAAVQSQVGVDIRSIAKEALAALQPKQEQIGDQTQSKEAENTATEIPSEAKTRSFVIQNQHGLHARPAAIFVQTAAKFDATVMLALQGSSAAPVSAASLNAIATLNIRKGDSILVYAWGKEAAAFLAELEALVQSEFGEKSNIPGPAAAAASPNAVESSMQEADAVLHESGSIPRLQCISAGIAEGIVWKLGALTKPKFSKTQLENDGDHEAEQTLLVTLHAEALKKIDTEIASQQEESARSILTMQRVMMNDPDLLQKAKNKIQEKRHSAAYAWWMTCSDLAETYRKIQNNSYLNERADDVIDAGIRLLRESADVSLPAFSTQPEDAVLFIDVISADSITKLNLKELKGIVTQKGGSSSHAAIIARSHGIPMISGYADEDMDAAKPGQQVIVDATQCLVHLAPEQKLLESYRKKQKDRSEFQKQLRVHACEAAITVDGVRIECSANIGSGQDADGILELGADGVGLFRSEFLFLNRNAPPTEEEQYRAYAHVARKCAGKSVVLRILDVGGDKQIPYLQQPKESNPFLGVRGVRFDLAHSELLLTQLRALLRAAVHGDIKMMIPMVIDGQEILNVQKKCREAEQELEKRGEKYRGDIPVGIMIETPASVFHARELAQHAAFFSIGTNDLVQYVLAVERDNEHLASLYDLCHPAVLQSLVQICEVAGQCRIPLSVCGESAADFEALPILLGLGICRLSATAERIAAQKHLIRSLSMEECRQTVAKLLTRTHAQEIREQIRSQYPQVVSLQHSL